MRQPQYDAHWIEQFAQISDGVGDWHRAANVDDIMFPFLSNLYPQTCRKFTTIVQQSDVNEGEWALDLEMPLHVLGDQSTVVGGGSAVRDEVHLLARDCVPEFGRSLVRKTSCRHPHFGRTCIPANCACSHQQNDKDRCDTFRGELGGSDHIVLTPRARLRGP